MAGALGPIFGAAPPAGTLLRCRWRIVLAPVRRARAHGVLRRRDTVPAGQRMSKFSGDGGNRQSIGLGETHINSWIRVDPINSDAVSLQDYKTVSLQTTTFIVE